MKNKGLRIFLHILFFVAVFAAFTAVVMLLWNALIPSIIGWGSINYLQAAGLLVLSKLLFGGFGHHRRFPFRKHGKHDRHLHETMKNMSRDERREFIRERMAKGFGPFCNDKTESED